VLAAGLAFLAYHHAARAGDPSGQGVKPVPRQRPLPVLGNSSDAEQVRTINARLAEKWKASKITPSARVSDHEFIRRATLDIIGRIATPKEIEQYLRDPELTRRALLIDRLLKSEEYARNWANIWTVWLMTRTGENAPGQEIYHEQMHKWLEDQFAKEAMSYKDMVSDILTASGKTNENGAVNYILAHLGEPNPPGKQTEEGKYTMVPVTWRTTRLFLGLQTQCAQCHPHPFNKEFNQKHFWGIDAFFRQVDTPRGRPDPNNRMMPGARVLELVDNSQLNPEGIVFYEQRNGVVLPTKPVFLLGTTDPLKPATVSENRRQALAKFITSNPYFAKAYVNRMWAHFFGRGFTNPVDDFGPENEPSHPELLDELSTAFAHYGYDPKKLIRWICNSDAYGLSCVANKTNEKADAEPLFSRMLLKAMTPEQLFESLMTATQAEMFESRDQRKKLRQQTLRALTANFGDDEGNEVTFNGTVVQALLMMNGKNLNDSVVSKERGTVALTLATKRGPRTIMDHLYLAALNRLPTANEVGKIMDIYKRAPVKQRDGLSFWQDLFWALLNSNEFILNH
jgi:hypothetical protein